MPARVAVLGAGSWGTAMAALLSGKVVTTLWARRPELAAEMVARRRNPDYVPDVTLPPGVLPTALLEEALAGVEVVVMATPSHGFRNVLSQAVPHLPAGVPVISLTKGLEQGTAKRMTEVIAEVAPGHPYGVLTGPNLVHEILAGHPTATVVAVSGDGGFDDSLAGVLQRLFNTERFRVYTNPDVVGCELAGSLKNVMAIASGMADGMGFGANTRAALITRGLAELSRVGIALGGHPMTFAGLAGMGDLVATCISPQSRNRYVGEQLGRGRPLHEITAENRWVAEGVRTSTVVVELSRRVGVETPIAEQVVAVLHEGKQAADVVADLMARVMKPERELPEQPAAERAPPTRTIS
ncbi:MAG: NAD(P)H-dependent glycerol-3-phosphate dehydrogenase [Acidimicrobiales bacterium]|nr:NAD(P)-dependent glycerol-3-phosphate dehydrogenase [Actinomycetota bacterium]